MTQLKPPGVAVAEDVAVTVEEGEAAGVGDGEVVPVGEGVGVVPGRRMVKSNSALRWIKDSVALIVCFPIDQLLSTVMVTSKVPSLPADTMLPDRGTCFACSELIARTCEEEFAA